MNPLSIISITDPLYSFAHCSFLRTLCSACEPTWPYSTVSIICNLSALLTTFRRHHSDECINVKLEGERISSPSRLTAASWFCNFILFSAAKINIVHRNPVFYPSLAACTFLFFVFFCNFKIISYSWPLICPCSCDLQI